MGQVRVIDAIMGSGKTTAAINMINGLDETRRVVYISRYLSEADRIKAACPDKHFKAPGVVRGSKANGLRDLVEAGENIACSHQLFTWLDQDTASIMRDMNYVVIIDEVIEVFSPFVLYQEDVDLMDSKNLLIKEKMPDTEDIWIYRRNPDVTYTGMVLSRTLKKIEKRPLIVAGDGKVSSHGKDTVQSCQWILPPYLFDVSDDIYVLTYLFDGSPLHAYFHIYQIGIERWCIVERDGTLQLSPCGDGVVPYVPEYVRHLKDRIHVVMDKKRNDVGKRENALSASWYWRAAHRKDDDRLNNLRINIRWFFRNMPETKDLPASKRMWAAFPDGIDFISDGGYKKALVPFNCMSTNDYRDRVALAYCVNVYAKPSIVKCIEECGVSHNEDSFALSYMVQWIWRSAIREGHDIWIYIPSKRMREILLRWIDSVSAGLVPGSETLAAS